MTQYASLRYIKACFGVSLWHIRVLFIVRGSYLLRPRRLACRITQGASPTLTLLDGVALSDYLAHLARNLPDLAERGAYGTLLVLVMAAGFVLAWLIQASRRQRVVRQLIETHIQEEHAEQKKTRLLAKNLVPVFAWFV